MTAMTPCPTCGHILEPVHNSEGEVLGYFCRLVIDNGCDYIAVQSSAEYEAAKQSNKKQNGST